MTSSARRSREIAPSAAEQQRRLADAGLAADEHERRRHEPAAEHAVELRHAGRDPLGLLGDDVDEAQRRHAATGAPARRRARGSASATIVPNSPQPGQRPSQRPDVVPHSVQTCWTAAAFATASTVDAAARRQAVPAWRRSVPVPVAADGIGSAVPRKLRSQRETWSSAAVRSREECARRSSRVPARATIRAVVDAVWRGEALGALLWALAARRAAAPTTRRSTPTTVVAVDPRAGAAARRATRSSSSASPRGSGTGARARRELQAVGGARAARALRDVRPADRRDGDARATSRVCCPRPMRGDFRAFGKVYRQLSRRSSRPRRTRSRSSATTRSNWLCGAGRSWDDVPLDT